MPLPALFSPLSEPLALWVQALSLPTVLRLAVVLASLPLLYHVLREEGQGWKDAALRRGFWALLGAAVFFQLTAQWVPERGTGKDIGKSFQSFMTGSLSHRMSYLPMAVSAGSSSADDEEAAGEGETAKPAPNKPGTKEAPSSGKDATKPDEEGDDLKEVDEETELRESAAKRLRAAAADLPENAYVQRYAGIVEADLGRYDAAIRYLERSSQNLMDRAPDRARQERQMWQSLFGPTPPSRGQIEEARAKIDRFELGWIGRVGLAAAYRRINMPVPEDQLATIRRDAGNWFVGMGTSGFFMVMVVPQLGLISLVVLGTLAATGVLKKAQQEPRPVAHLLWESFILMMAAPSAFSLLNLRLRNFSPETQPGLIAALIVLQDLLYVVALAYLWYRLKQRGLGLEEVGFTRKHLAANITIGIMAAFIMIPASYLLGLLTSTVSDRFFPNVPQPYHPLTGMTAFNGNTAIRMAFFTTAAVGAPLFEELFFRGVLFGAIRRRSGLVAALLGSSAFFAIIHPQLPLGFLPLAGLAVGFCLLYEWRQSLVPGMVAHAMNNGLIFMMLISLFPNRS